MKYLIAAFFSFSAFADEYTIKCTTKIEKEIGSFEIVMKDSKEGGEVGATDFGGNAALLKMSNESTELTVQRGDAIFTKKLKGTPKDIKYEAGILSKHVFGIKGDFKVTCFPKDKIDFKKTSSPVVVKAKEEKKKTPLFYYKDETSGNCETGFTVLNKILEDGEGPGCFITTNSKKFEKVLKEGIPAKLSDFASPGTYKFGESEIKIDSVESLGDKMYKIVPKGFMSETEVYGHKTLSLNINGDYYTISCISEKLQQKCEKPKVEEIQVDDSSRTIIKDVSPTHTDTESQSSSAVEQ